MDNRHPKCECSEDQSAVPLANDLLAGLMALTSLHQTCSLNMMVAVQLVATYLRDSYGDESEARAMERDAADRAEQIYVRSQKRYEEQGFRTTLSKRRRRMC